MGLEVSGRFAPWTYAWGYPQLTLGVGGRYLDGRFMDASASAPTVTAFIPTGSAELGVVFWLVKDVVGVEAGATGAYTFGPATLNVGEGQGSWVEQMDISLDSGLLARF